MARPKKATVDYFPHYVNHGKTMFTIENKFGNDGYCFWFKLLEVLGATEQHFINCNNPETWEYLLAKTRLSEIIANEILDLLSKLNAIDKDLWQIKVIWSENFITNLLTVYARRDVSLYNKEDIKGLCMQKLPLNGIIDNIYPQSKVKESIVEESKLNDSCESTPDKPTAKKTVFIKPTESECINYFSEKSQAGIEASKFFNYYESNGWMVGKNKMKNWKAAASNWISNIKQSEPEIKKTYTDAEIIQIVKKKNPKVHLGYLEESIRLANISFRDQQHKLNTWLSFSEKPDCQVRS